MIQRSFAGGEVAPALHGRSDQAKFQSGLATCRNFWVRKEGGAQNRPGTEFVVEVKDSDAEVRLHKFVFNDDQTYVLEFGDEYLRFIRNAAQIEVSGVSAWQTSTAYVVGDLVVEAGTNYYCEEAHTSGTFATDLAAGKWHALTGDVYEIPTPYSTSDLDDLYFVQSGDIITICHPGHPPRNLARTGHTTWTLTAIVFAPSIAAPGNLVASGGAGSSINFGYRVTAVKEDTLEESEPATEDTIAKDAPTSAVPIALTWDSVTDAVEYNVYKRIGTNGPYGYIGTVRDTDFSDTGYEPNAEVSFPVSRTLFGSTDNYPGVVSYSQQRQIFARSNNDPERVWCSQTANFKNFNYRSPLQDDDAIIFTLAGRQVNEIRHLLELDKLLVLTSGGVQAINGDADGVLRPAAVNAKQQAGAQGSSALPPLTIGRTAIYLQRGRSVVRDLRFSFEDNAYGGNDLTIWASHLFRGYTIESWDYSENHHSIVWAVRSDGTLLGLTYMPEHEVWGWHRHDTGASGVFEQVTVVPEGTEDAVYVVVKRTIDGATKRYIERLHSREIDDLAVDAFFVDSGLSYDGRNTAATTMTLSGGTDWLHTEDLTLTSSASEFVAGDVGNAYVLTIGDDTVKCTITAYTSATEVTVRANKTVPDALQDTATDDWSKAVDELDGLDHLEGETISVLGDGNVVPQVTVSGGSVTLDNTYSVIHAGLPIEADLETLDISNPQGETLVDKKKLVTKATLRVEESRGIFVGPDADHLTEAKQRDTEGWGEPIEAETGAISVRLQSTWTKGGRVFVRQSDPLPLTVLAVAPAGEVARK
jgi:hypothetical protein